MSAETVRARFVNVVEAQYDRQRRVYERAHLQPEKAHSLAFEDAKRLGYAVLEQLRQRGVGAAHLHSPALELAREEASTQFAQPSPSGMASASRPAKQLRREDAT